jgi:protein gp37
MGNRDYHKVVTGWKTRRWNGNIITLPNKLDKPLHWRKPRKIFVCSMSDLFHEKVPFEFIDDVFTTIFNAQQHTYQILTKRIKRMAEYFSAIQDGWIDFGENRDSPPPFVWLGVTVSTQAEADEKIPILLQMPAAVRFVSIEPMLEGIDITPYLSDGLVWQGRRIA